MFTPMDYLNQVAGIVAYVLTALGMYSIAKRRGIKNPWLAWIPVADMWVLGCISDQYRHVAKGQVCNKRKSLLILTIVGFVLMLFSLGVIAVIIVQIMPYLPEDLRNGEAFLRIPVMDEEAQEEYLQSLIAQVGTMTPQMTRTLMIEAAWAAIPALVAAVCLVAQAIIMCMALYDLFASCDPSSATLRLVLSIVISGYGGILRAIFIFIGRNRDDGMPPRGDEIPAPLPAYTPYGEE